MNIIALSQIVERRFAKASVFACATLFSASSLFAGEPPADNKSTPAPVEEVEYKNWIELSIGGLIIHGDGGQFKQQHGVSGDVFGGIEDLHYEQTIGKNGQFTVDGHAIFDNNGYDFKVSLSQPDLGYVRVGYTEFRTWYDGNGGYFPINGQFFEPPNQELPLDRGEAWIEFGLRMPKLPEITVHYSHLWRNGEKDSTIWGDTTLTGLAVNPTRKIAPAFRNIDETRDIVTLDIAQNFGNTGIGLGVRYEHSDVDNRLQLERGAGQLPPAVPFPGAQRFITQKDKNTLDSWNGHVSTETRIGDSIWFTTAYSYSTLDSDISGTRIIGAQYHSMYGDPILTLQGNDHGVLNLSGISNVDEHVFNANFMWAPIKTEKRTVPKGDSKGGVVESVQQQSPLTVLAAFRYTHQDKDSESSFLDTNTTANTPPFSLTNPQGGFHRVPDSTPRFADSSDSFDNFAETLELRYTGFADWVFYARGEWEEESGDVHEHEIVGPTDQGNLNKDTDLWSAKYVGGINWYPLAGLNFSTQYFHRLADYSNDFLSELATAPVPGSERNQRLLHQKLDTDNFNMRVTWRPPIPAKLGTLALVARYDYVLGTINGKWGVSPAGPLGVGSTGFVFTQEQTAEITNNVFTGSATWNPTARFYLQGNFSYVLNETNTPADYNLIPNTSPTVTDFHNDYWTASGAAGFVLDDKTDLRADYSYYHADNYDNNALVALPYGMTATEYVASVSVSRQLTKRTRLKLQYTYFNYTDEVSGGHDNYEAHSIYSSLQFQF